MSLTINLSADLEHRLRATALAEGVPAEEVVVSAIVDRLEQPSHSDSPATAEHLSADESRLLTAINQGLAGSVWERYRELGQRRQAETLTEAEQQELISLSNTIEQAHATRLGLLVELARFRKQPVEQVMRELGIRGPRHV